MKHSKIALGMEKTTQQGALEKSPLGRHRQRWKNIKLGLQEVG
jgi:hypothetical protein